MKMTTSQFVLLLGMTTAVLCLPLFGSNYTLRLATIMLMYSTLALSWNFIGGFAGYPSFGLAAFFGLGAYSGGVLQSLGFNMVLAWVFAIALSAVFGLLLGGILLRLRGHAFAIATLVIAEVLREITSGWTAVTGGGMGLNIPFFYGGWGPEAVSRLFFYAMFVVAAAAFITTYVVANNRIGFGLKCIRQNEDAATIVGLNTTLYKNIAFTISGSFAAAAGAVYASWTGYIDTTDVYDVLFSIKPIIMVLLGGLGTVFGPIIGAVGFLILDEIVWRNFLEFHSGVLGLLIVLLVLFLPAGLSTLDWRSRLARRFKTREANNGRAS